MRLRPLDGVEEVRLGDLSPGLNRRRPVGRFHRTQPDRLAEPPGEVVDPANGFRVALLDRGLLSPDMGDQLEPVTHVVEAGQRVGDDEHAIRDTQRVHIRDGQVFEVARRLVAEVADGAAAEPFGKALSRFGQKRLKV